MTDRAAYMSSRLIFPVSSPWAAKRRGSPTAYLSARQRSLLLYLASTQRWRGRRTLEEMAKVLGVTSRGQVSRELRRLRQLEVIGFKARRGQRGSHLVWISRSAARLRAVRHQVRNDSASTPFGGFISRTGLQRTWSGGGGPLLPGRAAARDGPRRGSDPPRALNARCPLGHPTRLGRRSWMRHARGVVAEWSGECRICARPILERVEVAIAEPVRVPSPSELADPALLDRRRRMAALFEADGIRSTTVRAYRDLE
jgi:hypothetical protein